MSEHLKRHVGGKPYSRNKSRKSFRVRADLSKHICIQVEEKMSVENYNHNPPVDDVDSDKEHVLSIEKANIAYCPCPENCIFKLSIFNNKNKYV